jgi:hypothetical protein
VLSDAGFVEQAVRQPAFLSPEKTAWNGPHLSSPARKMAGTRPDMRRYERTATMR